MHIQPDSFLLLSFPAIADRMLAQLNLLDASPNSQVRKLDDVLRDLDEIPRIKERMAKQEEQMAKQEEQMAKQENETQLLKQEVERMSLAAQYSTRSEHDVGSIILDHTRKEILKRLEFPTQVPQCSLELKCSLLSVSSSKKHEDQVINEPMMNLMQYLLEQKQIKLKALDCTLFSPLMDARGREQKADLILLSYGDLDSGSVTTWPMVVSCFEGKHDLELNNLCIAIGQCKRRSDAILEQQPWRDYVICVFHCLDKIGFLKVNRKGEPSVSDVLPFLEKGEDGNLIKGAGFHILMHLMESGSFGWERCPYSVLLQSTRALDGYSQSGAVCARSSGKRVFIVQGKAGESRILKASEEYCMHHEHEVLKHLQGVHGILTVSDLFTVDIQIGADKTQMTAFLMEPCTVVTPSSATPALFAQYAQTLVNVSKLGVHHNDISLDNLLCQRVGGQLTGVIIDWEHATWDDHGIRGFRGKRCFASESAFEEQWTASLENDLESLFYVAVSCCMEDMLEWPRVSYESKMRVKRRQECGLHLTLRGSGFLDNASAQRKGLWFNYLNSIRTAMLETRRNPSNSEKLIDVWLSKE